MTTLVSVALVLSLGASAQPPASVCGAPVVDGYVAVAESVDPAPCLREYFLARHAAFFAGLGGGLRARPLPASQLKLIENGSPAWYPGQGVTLGLSGYTRSTGGRRVVHLPSLEARFAHEAGHALFEEYGSYQRVQSHAVRARAGPVGDTAYEDALKGLTEMTGDLLSAAWMKDPSLIARPGPFQTGEQAVAYRDYSRLQPFPQSVNSYYQMYSNLGSRFHLAFFTDPRYEGRQGAALHAMLTGFSRLLGEIENSEDREFLKRFGLTPSREGHAHILRLVNEELGKASLPPVGGPP